MANIIQKELPSKLGFVLYKLVMWFKTIYFCKYCGKKDVWIEQPDGDDYYHEYTGYCLSCDSQICCLENTYELEPENGNF